MSVHAGRAPGLSVWNVPCTGLCPGLCRPARAGRGVCLPLGAAGSFLMSLMAAEPCPGSSPCPSSLPCSHHPANPEVSLSPPPLLDSLLPPAVSSLWVVPAVSCTSGKCFSWFSQGAEIPSAAFLRSWVFSPGIYRCLTPSFPPFSPCFLGNPSEHRVG